MTKRKSDFTLPTTSLDELFSSQEERDDAKLERVKDIPLTELHPFKDHPFKIQNDDEMKRLIESIQKFGTLTPALARPLPEGGYELTERLHAVPRTGDPPKEAFAGGGTARPDDLRHPCRAKAQPAGAVQIQAGGHSQILPPKLYGQASLRYGHQAVGAMAAQAGTGQGQSLIRTENVCGARLSHNGKNGTGRVQWPCRCRTVRECQIQRTEVKQIWYQDIYRLKRDITTPC